MRVLVQRVQKAEVSIDDDTHGTLAEVIPETPARSIGHGLLLLVGIGQNDTETEVEKIWNKLSTLRIFEDESGKTNLSLADVKGEVLAVSQFTLYADCKRGRRPGFSSAASPEKAHALWQSFAKHILEDVDHAAFGEFGALMRITSINDGPFTIWLDSDEL